MATERCYDAMLTNAMAMERCYDAILKNAVSMERCYDAMLKNATAMERCDEAMLKKSDVDGAMLRCDSKKTQWRWSDVTMRYSKTLCR